jgi:small subunit ribosomal protein S16
VAVKIKLKRIGKKREPHYRIVVADARTKRGGRAIEEIGQYHPKEDPSVIQLDSERAQYWLGVGAQPTEAVAAIMRVTGDWQTFRGEPAPPAMLVAKPKQDKHALFAAAAKEAADDKDAPATTPKAKKAPAKKKAAASAKPAEPEEKAEAAEVADTAETTEPADKPETTAAVEAVDTAETTEPTEPAAAADATPEA